MFLMAPVLLGEHRPRLPGAAWSRGRGRGELGWARPPLRSQRISPSAPRGGHTAMRTHVHWADSAPRPSQELPAASGSVELSEDTKGVFDTEAQAHRAIPFEKQPCRASVHKWAKEMTGSYHSRPFRPLETQYSKSLCSLVFYNVKEELRKRLEFQVGLHRERMIDISAGKGLGRPVKHQTCSQTGLGGQWGHRGQRTHLGEARLPFAGSGTWQRLASRVEPWRKALPRRETRLAPGGCSGPRRQS